MAHLPVFIGLLLLPGLPLAPKEASVPGTPPPASASGPAAVPEPRIAEIARGCVQAPKQTLARAKASALGSPLRRMELPQDMDHATACFCCTMGPDTPAGCRWASAASAPDTSGGPCTAAPPPASDCLGPGPRDLFGTVDVPTLLRAFLLQASPSSNLPQMARRLGLLEIVDLCFAGRLRGSAAADLDVLLRLKPDPRGIFAVFGPPVAPRVPVGADVKAVGSVSASVIPSRVWDLLETLMAGAQPLQYTLLRVQLDTIEKAQGVRWADDILGTRAALWTFYEDRAQDAVLVLEGADGTRAVTFLAAAIESLADLLPGLQMSVFKKAVTMATLTVPPGTGTPGITLHLAFSPKRVVVATSAAALAPHMMKRDGTAPGLALRPAPATVFGTWDAGAREGWLRRLPPEIRPPFIKNARAAWFFSSKAQGWRGSVEMTVERQTIGQ